MDGFEPPYMEPAPSARPFAEVCRGSGCGRISGLCVELVVTFLALMESARLVLIGPTASRALRFDRFASRRSDRLPITDNLTSAT
jgi:hypothetical protein